MFPKIDKGLIPLTNAEVERLANAIETDIDELVDVLEQTYTQWQAAELKKQLLEDTQDGLANADTHRPR